MDELDALRKKIDMLDKDLLILLAKRFDLVDKIGYLKKNLGLLIYSPDREKDMLATRRKEAVSLGISPDLVEDILRRIIRESYFSENKKGFKPLRPDLRPIVMIGDNNQIFQILNKMLILSGYQVHMVESTKYGVSSSLLVNAGMVFINMSIYMMMQVIGQLPPLLDDCILVDVSSIKDIALYKAMLSVHKGPVLGLNFILNTDMGHMVKQVIIYYEWRYPESYQWFLKQIKMWGAYLYCCDF